MSGVFELAGRIEAAITAVEDGDTILALEILRDLSLDVERSGDSDGGDS